MEMVNFWCQTICWESWYVKSVFFFFWTSCSDHCLAAPDLVAGVEQPFDCFIVQNRQAMQSMGRSMDWTLEDNMSTVCSSAPHLQAAEEAIPHLYKQERKRPTPVRRRLSRTQALVGRVIPVGECRCRGWKCGVLGGGPSTPHSIWWSAHCAARMSLSDELMRYCAAGTNGCLDLRRRTFALDGRVSAEWSSCPGSMARHAGDSVAPLRRSSVGWMPARFGRLSAGVGHSHPVTMRRASLMAGSTRRVWALRHQTRAQYSIVECTRARVAVRSVVAPAPQPEPASRLRSVTGDVSFLQSDSRCRRYVSDLSNVTSRYLGSEQKGRVSLLYLTSSSRLASDVLHVRIPKYYHASHVKQRKAKLRS